MSKARGWPGGWQMPGPRATQISKCSTHGTDKAGKRPAVARVEGGGGLGEKLELADALIVLFHLRSNV